MSMPYGRTAAMYNLRLTQSLQLNPHHFDLHTFPSNQHQAFEYVIEDSTPIENEDAVMALGRPRRIDFYHEEEYY